MQFKPANFIVSAHVAHLGHPTDVDPTRFHLIGSFTSDARQWLNMTWIDQYSGASYHISTGRSDDQTARVQSYRDVFADYCVHPESKSAALDGTPCDRRTVGLLQRRHVGALDIAYIGKEANELDAVDAGLVHDANEVLTIYVDAQDESWKRDVLPAAGFQAQPTDDTVSHTPMNAIGGRRSGASTPVARANVVRNASQSFQ